MAQTLRRSDGQGVRLVVCLTLWLSIWLGRADVDGLVATLRQMRSPVVLVTDEPGQGIVPDNALAGNSTIACHNDMPNFADVFLMRLLLGRFLPASVCPCRGLVGLSPAGGMVRLVTGLPLLADLAESRRGQTASDRLPIMRDSQVGSYCRRHRGARGHRPGNGGAECLGRCLSRVGGGADPVAAKVWIGGQTGNVLGTSVSCETAMPVAIALLA